MTGCPGWTHIPKGWQKTETCQLIAIRCNLMFAQRDDDEDDADPGSDVASATASALSPSRKPNKRQLEMMLRPSYTRSDGFPSL